jgi:hypothetical protein
MAAPRRAIHFSAALANASRRCAGFRRLEVAMAKSWLLSFVLLAGCGGGEEPPAPAVHARSGGGERTAAPADTSPPAPCAVLAADETSKLFGQPPDNARAVVVTLEDLPTKAPQLEGQLVRTTGTIEAVGRDGKWIAIHDTLFDGWGFAVVRDPAITLPAGTRGCAITIEGTIERVVEDENDVELQKREGRPIETCAEQGPTAELVVLGLEAKRPSQ